MHAIMLRDKITYPPFDTTKLHDGWIVYNRR